MGIRAGKPLITRILISLCSLSVSFKMSVMPWQMSTQSWKQTSATSYKRLVSVSSSSSSCHFLPQPSYYYKHTVIKPFSLFLSVSRVTHPLMTHQNWLKNKLKTLSQVHKCVYCMFFSFSLSYKLSCFPFLFTKSTVVFHFNLFFFSHVLHTCEWWNYSFTS